VARRARIQPFDELADGRDAGRKLDLLGADAELLPQRSLI
jgi:hypothetical protein